MSNIYGINRGAFGSFMFNDDVVTLDTTQTITGEKTFTSNLHCDGQINAAEVDTPIVVVREALTISDGGDNSSIITQTNIETNILNSCPVNNTILTITGFIPSFDYTCLIRTDSTTMVPINGVLTSGVYFANIGMNSNFYIASSTTTVARIACTILNQINSTTTLALGTMMISNIGTYFSLGTYVISSLGSGNYGLSANCLTLFARVNISTGLVLFNRPYYSYGYPGSITFNYNPVLNLQILDAASNIFSMMSIRQSGTLFNYQNTFTMSVPQCSIVPTATNHLTNKAYVDSFNPAIVSTTAVNQYISGVKTFGIISTSSDSTGTKPTLNLLADTSNTYIQGGLTSATSNGTIIFSGINGGATPYCTMNNKGIFLPSTCMYGRNDGFTFSIPDMATGLYPIGFTFVYGIQMQTFTSGVYTTTICNTLSNGVWMISAYHQITLGTGSYPVNAYTQVILSINSGSGSLQTWPLTVAIPANAVGYLQFPLSNAICVVTAPVTLQFSQYTNMIVGTATRGVGLIYTKIA